MKRTVSTLIIVLCCAGIPSLDAQEITPSHCSRFKIGVLYGVGNQTLLDVKYDYRVIFYQPQLYYTLKAYPAWSLELVVQPQYNTTIFRPDDDLPIESSGFEFGLNAGLLARKSFLNDFMSVYICGTVGPHYVSGVPKRQSSGFIFADTFFVGVTAQLAKDIHLDLRPGIRHISNAGLKKHNQGINNMIYTAGLMVKF